MSQLNTMFALQDALDTSGLFDNAKTAEENSVADPQEILSEEAAIRALTRGGAIRASVPTTLTFARELRPSDFQKEMSARQRVSPEERQARNYPRLRKIRTIHHQAAYMLASGAPPMQVARSLGFSASRVSVLQQDPAFRSLMETYKSAIIKDTLDVKSRALALSTLAMEELQDRLLDSPEELNPRLLLDIASQTLDRAGYSPAASREGQASNLLTEDQMEALKREVVSEAKGQVKSRETRFDEQAREALSAPVLDVDTSVDGNS